MSSSGLTRKDNRMRKNLTNNNKPMMKHKIAITYSTCCTSVKIYGNGKI